MTITRIPVRTLPDIFYEDPEPVEDGMQQAIPLIDIVSLLRKHFADRSDVFVGGGGFVMYDERMATTASRPTATSPSMRTSRASKRWLTWYSQNRVALDIMALSPLSRRRSMARAVI